MKHPRFVLKKKKILKNPHLVFKKIDEKSTLRYYKIFDKYAFRLKKSLNIHICLVLSKKKKIKKIEM